MAKEKKASEYISEFLNFMNSAVRLCDFCENELVKQDKITQDFLHSLELNELKYADRAKIATQLALNRRDRRYYKDRIEELTAIKTYVNENKKVFAELSRLLGAVRKSEKHHIDRVYVPKVLDMPKITSKSTDKEDRYAR